MTDVKDFILEEESKMDWLDKMLNNYPVVENTKFLATIKKIKPGNNTVLHPSVLQKVISFCFICLAFFMWLQTLRVFLKDDELRWVMLGLLCFASVIIYIPLYYSFLNKKTLYNIVLNTYGITCGKIRYSWPDVIETYVMSHTVTKPSQYHLVLHTKTEGFKTFDLFKFNISVQRLSSLIEYYKTNAAINQ